MSGAEGLPVGDILDVMPVAVVLIDPDGRVAGWNVAAEVLYGHRAEDVLGVSALEALFDPDDQAMFKQLLAGVASGQSWDGDARVRRRDGALLVSSFRLVAAGAGGAAAWVATDGMDQGLAEQQRSVLLSAEHAARATAEDALGLLEAILGAAPVAIAVFDTQLRYVRVNDAYAVLSGKTPAEHVGGTLGEVVPVVPEIASDLASTLRTGRVVAGRLIERELEAGGGVRHFSVSYFPVRAGDTLVGAGLTAVEITQLKRAEADRVVLLRRAEEARERLSILATASSVLTTTLNLDEMLDRLAGVLAPSVADWCALALFGGGGRSEHLSVFHRDLHKLVDAKPALAAAGADLASLGRAASGGRGRLTEHTTLGAMLGLEAADTPPGPLSAALDVPFGAGLAVPIDAHGEVMGVLALATSEGRSLDGDDLSLAAEVARRTALAVSNARAFQHEREIAETLQRALLPTTVPAVEGLDIAVRYLPATDGASVGGDWYDVLILDEDTTGIAIGDVVGHDVSASTSMGQLRSALRVLAHDGYEDPALTLSRVDRAMGSLGVSYATCIFGVLDRPSSTFRWSNAGHPPPLLVRDGAARLLSGGSGVLLGVTDGGDAHEDSLLLHAGDVLVLYTDGLVERRGSSLDAGLDLLKTAAVGLPGRSAEEVCEGLVSALVPMPGREDDVAILVAVLRPQRQTSGVHRMAFGAAAESVGRARRFAADVLTSAGWGAQVDLAVLLVSELVTNAVRHAVGPCTLRIEFSDERVELAVEDGDGRIPAPREAGPLDEGGRGLYMVATLADDWGIRPAAATDAGGPGKAVWFALRREA
ncbi:SpoIIE family protein phosphatase [Acidiferrimicrobium sp. IK]|uniref:SpoIIE family protein phosphatase n=1 Tax=Acidiferrimicrobium sp. IK TaxID=2871700 RepID=UPI0021CB0D19|nr:SpoIIE family protein phosphatase [Acidiferrimicrobium sp. IK]MCU4183371.1 SpoIIE family protein phosphatase [Acidiferrimicrobium sp. IK]